MGEFDDVMLVTLGLGHSPGDGLAAIAAVRFDKSMPDHMDIQST